MKKLRQLAIFGTLLYSLSIVGCTKDLSGDVNDLKTRVSSLEEQAKVINKDIADIKDVIKAINGHEQVTEVKELADKSGYSITFSKDGKPTRTIEIKHGSKGEAGANAPVIGTAVHPEAKVFCWNQTIDGVTTWLTDGAGKPIPLTGPKGEDGTTSEASPAPIMGVDAAGFWTIDLQDGTGVKRMKDANGNDVKAVGKDGAAGSDGSSGALGFTLSADGRYAIFTISGNTYKFEISAITIGFSDYGVIYVEKSAVRTLSIVLPTTLKKSDFSAISAKIEGKAGGASDVVTRAAATANWQVVLSKPVYNTDGTIKTAPKVEITAPSGASVGDGAMLVISLLDNNGNVVTSSRAIEIVGFSNVEYPSLGTAYELNSVINEDAPSNVIVAVGTNLTAGQTFTIPAKYTKANAPVITLKFSANKSFAVSDAAVTALTINAPTYNGMIVIEGIGANHEAIKNDAASGKALKVNAVNATIIVQNVKIVGESVIDASPTTFVVRAAVIGATKINNGSVDIEKGSTVASLTTTSVNPVSISGTVTGEVSSTKSSITVQKGATVGGEITSTSTEPIVIEGDVKKVTSESAKVEVKDGATTDAIKGAGVIVEEGAKVKGDLTSTGEAKVEVKGEVTGSVDAKNSKEVEIGEKADITGDLTTDTDSKVTLPPTANVGGEVKIPISSANISIGEKGYGSLENAISEALENDIINLKQGVYQLKNGAISEKITVKGAGVDLTEITGEIEITKSLNLEKLHINVTSTKTGVGAINIKDNAVILTTKDVRITQGKLGTADGTATSGLGIYVQPNIDNITIDMTNTDILLAASRYQRGIAFPFDANEGTDMKLNMDNCKIICTKNAGDMDVLATYSVGIGFGGLVSPVVNIKNSTFAGMYYPINWAGTSSTGMKLTIDNTKLTGYCALNLRGTGMTIDIINGSVLTGKNLNKAGSNDFATVVFNSGTAAASNNTLNLVNSTIKTFANNTALQYPIDIRENTNVTINLKENSKLIDAVLNPAVYLDYMIVGPGLGCVINDDGSTTITGGEGVKLNEDIPTE